MTHHNPLEMPPQIIAVTPGNSTAGYGLCQESQVGGWRRRPVQPGVGVRAGEVDGAVGGGRPVGVDGVELWSRIVERD